MFPQYFVIEYVAKITNLWEMPLEMTDIYV